METKSLRHLYKIYYHKKEFFPFSGQIELTYRCNLNCVHCYCKGLETAGQMSPDKEMTTAEIKKILDELQREGCLSVSFTGGDPLIRDDFWEIYSYAKEKGFIISILTNGMGFTEKLIDFLVKRPPYNISITLNGITEDTYEAISQIKGSYFKVMRMIKLLAKKRLPLLLKTVCLKQNKHEVVKVKAFCDRLLGKPPAKQTFFQYGHIIFPKLNGDTGICDYRLSSRELLEISRQDEEMWRELQSGFDCDIPDSGRDGKYLYRCTSWKEQFFINPYGRLKFCNFSDKFSVDLKTTAFKTGFYEALPKLLNEEFKTSSKCRDCRLRPICSTCPAKAYLETGNEEGPVPYYCQLAEATAALMPKRHTKTYGFSPALH